MSNPKDVYIKTFLDDIKARHNQQTTNPCRHIADDAPNFDHVFGYVAEMFFRMHCEIELLKRKVKKWEN